MQTGNSFQATALTGVESGNLNAATAANFELDAQKQKEAVRKSRGFMLVGGGSFLGFLSVLLSILNPVPELFNVFLYGFTMLSICIILPGFYLLFERGE